MTVDEQRELIPDDAIKAAFLRRDDIAVLTPEEQERRWAKHLEGLASFRSMLARMPILAISEE